MNPDFNFDLYDEEPSPETIVVNPEDVLDRSDLLPHGEFIKPAEKVEDTVEEKLRKAISALTSKYGLDPNSISIDKVLDNVDLINTDDDTFDLIASKLVTDYLRRVNLRGILTQAKLVEKVWDVLEKSIDNIEYFDADTISMVAKGFEYQEKLTNIMDRFKKTGVEESLKHISTETSKKSQKESVIWTNEDIQRLINGVHSSGTAVAGSQADDRIQTGTSDN